MNPMTHQLPAVPELTPLLNHPQLLHRAALLSETRRHFFERCAVGLGSMSLATFAARNAAAAAQPKPADPLQPKPTHHPAKAKNVIFLFMAGGPSQLDLFEHKPLLNQLNGQPIPDSYTAGKRFAFMDSSHRNNLLASRRRFRQHGQSGTWLSDLLPHTAGIVDEITVLTTCKTDLFNHAPAKFFMNTGSGLFGRPSMGAWITYGLGSECDNLPGFVVLQSGPRGPRGGAVLWGSGVLPTSFQGVPLRSQGDPIVNLSTPAGITAEQQRQVIDAVTTLNRQRLNSTGDTEIATRINAAEMAFRMQSSAPELMDTSGETRQTLDLYGIRDPQEASFARNCLLARRLVERGVRFVQLYDTNWDHHGGATENLEQHLPEKARDIDQPCAALVRDLQQRGLLDNTIVIWGGEFGRTPMGEVRESTGRNHHIDAFTMWFAGGGFKQGQTWGRTDEFGFGAVENPAHVRDIHATLLHQLGINHERLTFRSQGLDFRLTGVHPAHFIEGIVS